MNKKMSHSDSKELSFYELLRNAIYKQAADDYEEALKHNDKIEIKKIEKFLRSGALFVDSSIGEYIITKIQKDVAIWRKKRTLKTKSKSS